MAQAENETLSSTRPKQKIRLFVKVMQYISSFPQA